MARLMISDLGEPGISLLYSRIRSNTITVSFMEKPITVSTAAIHLKIFDISLAISFELRPAKALGKIDQKGSLKIIQSRALY
jgi:hypothetical protein